MPRLATPTYRRRWMGQRLEALEKRMGVFERRILHAAHLRSMEDVDAWLAVVSNDNKLRRMQQRVRVLVREIEENVRRWGKANLGDAYKTGTQVADVNLKRHGLKTKRIGRTHLNASAVNYAIEQLNGDMAMAVGSISQKLNRTFREMHLTNRRRKRFEMAVSEEVARKFVGADSVADSAKAMFERMRRSYTNAKGELQLVRVLGPSGKPRNYTLKYYTRMVARTRVREAVTQGVRNTMMENGSDFVQVTGYGCECDVCSEYEDKIMSVTGRGELAHPDFIGPLTPENEPPYHPNCTHTIVPYIPEPGEVVSDPFASGGGEVAA